MFLTTIDIAYPFPSVNFDMTVPSVSKLQNVRIMRSICKPWKAWYTSYAIAGWVLPFVDISSFLLSFKVGGCLFWTSKIDKILSMHRRMEMSWLDIFKAHIFQNTNSKVTNQLWYSHRRFVVWWSVSVSLRLRRSIRLSFFAFYDLMTRFVSFSITHHLVFHDLTIRKIVCDRLLWRL